MMCRLIGLAIFTFCLTTILMQDQLIARDGGRFADSGVPAACGGQIDIRGLRLLGVGEAHILNQRVSEDLAH
jgi:hypothetical protein